MMCARTLTGRSCIISAFCFSVLSAVEHVARKSPQKPCGGKHLIRANALARVDLTVKGCASRIDLLWHGIDDQHLTALGLKGEIKLRGVAEIFHAPKAEAM